MDKLDVMESLKQKEEELEALLRETRENGARIREDAVRMAEGIKLSALKELDRVVEEYKKTEMEKIDRETESIKSYAVKMCEELQKAADERVKRTADIVIDYILKGIR